jgi:hypothetical protein
METLIMSVVGIAVVVGVASLMRELIVAAKAKPSEVYQDKAVPTSAVDDALGYLPLALPDADAPSISGIGVLFHRLIEALAHIGHHV